MSDAWKKLNLEAAGLQALNLQLAQTLRKRRTAYLLWLLFPLGAHRTYLSERWGSLAYVALTALALIMGIALGPGYALAPATAEILLALSDLVWIDRRVNRVNKELRMRLYLGAKADPPPGYRGRYSAAESQSTIAEYVRIKEREKGGHAAGDATPPTDGASNRIPSFHEQERMLRELAKSRQRQRPKDARDKD